ncbi:MAG: hypothetical protein R3F56_18350 [Planctomycetota bacterium]
MRTIVQFVITAVPLSARPDVCAVPTCPALIDRLLARTVLAKVATPAAWE